MDIRSFFSKKGVDPKSEEPKKLKSAPKPKTKPEKEETVEASTVKRKRLAKKIINSDSDDDFGSTDARVVAESTSKTPSGPESLKEEHTLDSKGDYTPQDSSNSINNASGDSTVRTWILNELKLKDPEKAEDLDKDNCSADNIQTDIQYWLNGDKKLVDPSTMVKKEEKKGKNVDIDSYVMGLGVKTPKDTGLEREGGSVKKESPKPKEPHEVIEIDASPASKSPVKSPKKTSSRVQSPKSKASPAAKTKANTPKKQVVAAPAEEVTLFSDNDPEEPEEILIDSSATTSPAKKSPTHKRTNSEPANSPKAKKGRVTTPKNAHNVTSSSLPHTLNEESLKGSTIIGKKFVFTGELDNIDRYKAASKVQEFGGIVVSGVSGVTNYLVCGEKLEDGRPYTTGTKYKKACDFLKAGKDIKIIKEDEFLKLIGWDNEEFASTKPEVEEAPKTREKPKEELNSSKPTVSATHAQESSYLPLTEKYRPKTLADLIGNKKSIDKLCDWLATWDKVHKKGIKNPVKRIGYKVENVNSKCALLSGSPGIGKTTCAKLVAEHFKYTCVEFNASDFRSKAAIEKIALMATGGQTLGSTGVSNTLILLDEVDGISSGDRGGIPAVLSLIDSTKCPIICVCNDKSFQKMSGLVNKCYDIKFSSPTEDQFAARVRRICTIEKIEIPEKRLSELYEQSNGDLRYTLNYIQFGHSVNFEGASFVHAKDENYALNPFESCGRIFNAQSKTFTKKLMEISELFFSDFNLMPLMLQENYLKYLGGIKGGLPLMSKLSVIYIYADMVDKSIKTNQVYSLLPDLASLSAVIPSLEIAKAEGTAKERLAFPQWLGKNSTTTKNRRIMSELGMNLASISTVNGSNLVVDGYLDLIYKAVMSHLADDNVEQAADAITSYGLTRELVVEGITSLRLKSQDDLYGKVESKVKAKLTRKMSNQAIKVARRAEDGEEDPMLKTNVTKKKKRS
ncbi:replication factor RFC1 C terminal domain containing protein [Theileria equi strain WA]|uniref:Replication factor C subunit 1 n=1 Tax=Theileria equi strain WA TaxID=1537102 RepID=L1LDP1_THEEQ|nr:replication factor RFC1 C terminal domain containing protein [Theileria equi strain WA]EKX73365.1 replication factor RFC1 C terminal domain containing protein [Theileria equi strain WA]|eukprot:XP_004832817.1 replication factor RFC1 C terminal domain containing protein [Theileria equi strain WA]